MAAEQHPNVINAKLAEQMERFEEMAKFMKDYAETGQSLNMDERTLLSVAYKNVVGARRMSWRAVLAMERREGSSNELVVGYRKKIEKELIDICNEVKTLLKDHLVKNSDNDDKEAQVFYLKMVGDYCRYQAEVMDGNEEIKKESEEAYEKATEVAKADLSPAHPIRLGLALNYSVFYYEILQDKAKACDIAEMASNQVLDNPPDDEDMYKDSALIHQLLRDNLSLWKQSDDDDD